MYEIKTQRKENSFDTEKNISLLYRLMGYPIINPWAICNFRILDVYNLIAFFSGIYKYLYQDQYIVVQIFTEKKYILSIFSTVIHVKRHLINGFLS